MSTSSFHSPPLNSSLTSLSSSNTSSSQLNGSPKRSSDVSSSLRRYAKSPKPKVKRLGKPIEGLSSSYVGFRPSDFRSVQDLSHLRHFIESHSSSDQAASVLESLDTMLKSISMTGYEKFDPDDKLDTINKLIDAYSFAWNEGTLQLKQLSEDHAEIFVKIKNFYMFLLDQYPILLTDYQKQVAKLKKQCEEKDSEISILKDEIVKINQKDVEAREFIAGLRDEIIRIKDRKTYFKQELNDMTLKNDKLLEELTEVRCKMAKEIEAQNEIMPLGDEDYLANSANFVLDQKPEIEYVNIGINTDPIELPQAEIINDTFFQNHTTTRTSTFSEALEKISNTTQMEPHSALRHVIYNFMISESKTEGTKSTQIDNNAELKKFYWIFPKIISLMISGIQFEDSSHPFNTFEELLVCFLTHHYQTSFLVHQIYSSLILSAQLLDGLSPVIHLFNKFAQGEHDFYVFRFFHTILEFSVCYAKPDISTLATNELIAPEDTIILIEKDKARSVFEACFPFKDPPAKLNDGPGNLTLSYWSFMELMIEEFTIARSHFWSVLKDALLLADCPDNTSINYGHFASFMGIVFPGIKVSAIKAHWKALIIRETASENSERDVDNFDRLKKIDSLKFSSLTYLCAAKDETITNVMKIQTAKEFARSFFELSSPALDVLAFIVNRLTYYIPSISSQVAEIQSEFEFQSFKIRDALFMCNIASAITHYRFLLHQLDYLSVRDVSSIVINKNTPSQAAEQLIEHMKLREKVAGITSSV